MCNQSKSGGNLYAGGIYIYGGNSGSCSQYLTIANCALAYNYSDGSNGIVNIYSNNNTLDITRQVVIKNCYFSHNNNEVYNTSASGADIFQTGGVLTVEDCKFDYGENNNTSSYSGGSITLGKYIYSAAIRRCSFTNYTTNNYANGGAIAMGGSSNTYLIGNALIDSCYFSGNSVTNGTGNDVYCSNNYNNLTLGYNIFNSSATNITTAASTHGDLFIGYSGTSSSIVSGTNVNQFPMTATTYTASPTVPTISYTSCSSFSVTLLPISLTSFIGVCNGDQVVIMWQTATETGNHYFNLERSLDGTNFYSIGTIEGAGTSDQVHNYSFIDTSKIRGITYYRILQVDFDGKESSSAPISVDHSCASTDPFDMRIYPNPAHNWVYLECKIPSPCSGQIELFNDLGQLVLSQPTSFNYPGIQSESIDVSHLAQGLYIIRFTLNQQAFVFKFVKI